MSELGLARYSRFQILESDTYAFRPLWAPILADIAHTRKKEWVLGSRSMCLRTTEIEHIDGNAMHSVDRSFVRELRKELGTSALMCSRAMSRGDDLAEAQTVATTQGGPVCPARLLEAEQSFSLTRWPLSLVCVCLLLFDSWHRECWGGRQGERCLE